MISVDISELTEYLENVFAAWGARSTDATEITKHLISSNLTGHDSHGLLRAPWYLEKIETGDLLPEAEPTIVQETSTTAIVDGGWGFGMTTCRYAMELCMEKAREHNIACVSVRNANHVGRIGYYTDMPTEHGMIGMGGANLHGSSHCVAPFGGIDRKLPTNPISFAVPTEQDPSMVVDLTTSIVAEGKLQLRRNKDEPADEGWVMDHDGNATNDPWEFYREPKGALMPLGGGVGHKGYALSMAMDALSGGLSGSNCTSPKGTRHGNACWFIAINIEAFVPVGEFTSNISSLIEHVCSSRVAEGVDRVRYPGEPEAEMRQARLRDGLILDDHTWEWLTKMGNKRGVGFEGMVLESDGK